MLGSAFFLSVPLAGQRVEPRAVGATRNIPGRVLDDSVRERTICCPVPFVFVLEFQPVFEKEKMKSEP